MKDNTQALAMLLGLISVAFVITLFVWPDSNERAIENGFIILRGDKYRLEHVD